MNQILCIALAFVVGLLSSRLMKILHLPNVTGYLIAGIIFGPYCLGQFIGWGSSSTTSIEGVSWICDIALGFIAFSIGSSFKLSSLKSVGKRIIVITICEALGGCIFVLVALFLAKIFMPSIPTELILILGAIACATAPAATLMVIKQYKARGPLVNTLLPVVAFDDAVALIMFSILFSVAKAMASGTDPNFLDLIVWPLVSIISSITLGGTLGLLVSLGCKMFKSRSNRMIMCIAAIFVCVGCQNLPLSTWLGVDISISGLLSTMMVSAVFINMRKDSDRTFERIDFITAPIFMLFFVISGAELDITIFASEKWATILIIGGLYVTMRALGKWVGAYSSSKATKADPKVSKYLGFTLVPQAGVAIGLASTASSTLITDGNALLAIDSESIIGNQLVEYGGMILAIILAATIIYELTGPIITKIALTKAGEIRKEEPVKINQNTENK